jgi:hypothetical protein
MSSPESSSARSRAPGVAAGSAEFVMMPPPDTEKMVLDITLSPDKAE